MQTSIRAAEPLFTFVQSTLLTAFRIVAALAVILACLSGHAAIAQDAKLTLSPALIVTGLTPRLAIDSDGTVDLSQVTVRDIAVTPDHDVRSVTVIDTGPRSVGIALDLATNAQLGKRSVSVTAGGRTAKGDLDIIQGAALGVEWPGAASQNKAATTTVNVVSRAGVDLSKVTAGDVKMTPPDVSVVEITNQTADGLTLVLKVPPLKKAGSGMVRIGGEVNLVAAFSFAEPHAPRACVKMFHCCDGEASACTSCRPLDQVCTKAKP